MNNTVLAAFITKRPSVQKLHANSIAKSETPEKITLWDKVVPAFPQFRFPCFQLPVSNCGPKLLNEKSQN